MSDIMVLFIIILAIWLGIGSYVFYLYKKVGKLENEIEAIKSKDKTIIINKKN